MSKVDGILDVPIKKVWFDKIKSGEKTHEYRRVCAHWCHMIGTNTYRLNEVNEYRKVNKIRFRCGQTTKADDTDKTMLFEIKSIYYVDGLKSDLKYDGPIFDIEIGRRIS